MVPQLYYRRQSLTLHAEVPSKGYLRSTWVIRESGRHPLYNGTRHWTPRKLILKDTPAMPQGVNICTAAGEATSEFKCHHASHARLAGSDRVLCGNGR